MHEGQRLFTNTPLLNRRTQQLRTCLIYSALRQQTFLVLEQLADNARDTLDMVRRGLWNLDRAWMSQTFNTAAFILGALRCFYKSMLGSENFFVIILPRFARARMPSCLCLDFSKPMRDHIPGGFGKNRTFQFAFPDLLSNHTTTIEEERCQANAEEHPENRQNGNLFHSHCSFGLRNPLGSVSHWPC
jgi:hypothetical protein